ncbi:anoctamin-7-like isoform X2 [Convolutriloba macropyga]|uniref:anoctamin-7-like isoform X2 n=1 Tax=Convolutriloba macropyga TaxID=536237 RepID=UPI003F51C958
MDVKTSQNKESEQTNVSNSTLETAIDAELNEVKLSAKDLKHIRKKAKILHVVEGVLQSTLNGSLEKRIDFVVVFTPRKHEPTKQKEIAEQDRIDTLRKKFLDTCKKEGFEMSEESATLPAIGMKTFIKLHCTFDALCDYAEKLKIELPLAGCDVLNEDYLYQGATGFFRKKFVDHFGTEDDPDYISAPFIKEKMYLFEGFTDKTVLFRNSIRSLVAEYILESMDARAEAEITEEEKLKKWNLSWFLHEKIFDDTFVLHDESSEDPFELKNESYINERIKQLKWKKLHPAPDASIKNGKTSAVIKGNKSTASSSTAIALKEETVYSSSSDSETEVKGSSEGTANNKQSSKSTGGGGGGGKKFYYDARKDLHFRWCVPILKMLPLMRIRNYFGEKIALYFAWTETMIMALWIPAILGIIVFVFGLTRSVNTYIELRDNSSADSNSTGLDVQEILDIVNTAVDNTLTPYYSLFICLWATVFLELWKRRNASLKYEWDVNSFEDLEPDRPQFKGDTDAMDPFTGQMVKVFPFSRKIPRLIGSFVTLLFMVCVVLAATIGVIIYRAFSSWKWQNSAFSQLVLSTGLAAVMNACAILILEQIYKKLAWILTDWENHRTQTEYDDALIIKIFAFYFVNSYSSLFYIAFIRGGTGTKGILGLGHKFTDECPNDNCMSELALQTLVLMAAKPVPKFCYDIILPRVKSLALDCISKCRRSKVSPEKNDMKKLKENMMIREYVKLPLENFTLEEYLEKTIAFGYQVLFAPSIPLGPLVALIFWLVDIRLDPQRMLWQYRRPVAYIAEDIGTWYAILEFIAWVAVVVNAGVIAFTSSFGKDESLKDQLLIFLIFEHICFVAKFLLAYVIPDTPSHVVLAMRKENYEAENRLEEATKKGETLKSKIKYRSSREILEGTPYKQIPRNIRKREKKHKDTYRQDSPGQNVHER